MIEIRTDSRSAFSYLPAFNTAPPPPLSLVPRKATRIYTSMVMSCHITNSIHVRLSIVWSGWKFIRPFNGIVIVHHYVTSCRGTAI